MTKQNEFDLTFEKLKTVFKPFVGKLVLVHDTKSDFYLDMPVIMKNKKPLFFGAVRKGKAFVSFHLMPVYGLPELLDGVSPELKKRMQGKSCFNFTSVDDKQLKELSALTKEGYAKFSSKKMFDMLASWGKLLSMRRAR